MARMNSIDPKHISRGLTRFVAGLVVSAALLQAAPGQSPRTFATPDEAVQAIIEAAEHNDNASLLQLLGPGGKDILQSGDAAEDRNSQLEFAFSAHEKLQFDRDPADPDRVTFRVGEQNWPFPVPLVRKDGKWQFDPVRGKVEILARRIGGNELNVMEICRGYAEAQLEYASEDRDGGGILQYAQKMVSSPGKQDGLYSDNNPQNLVTKAFTIAAGPGKPAPYHGYYYMMLKSQGPDAVGGSMDYVVKGKMIGGFALIAWPAEYGETGVKTFIVNHEGLVYGKDLGINTAMLARHMTSFNPDKTWKRMDLE